MREAVEGADIVIDASRLSAPEVLVDRAWLKPGALVMPYGAVLSTSPDLPLVADRFIVDDWAQAVASKWGQYHVLIERGAARARARVGRDRADRRGARARPRAR